MNIKKLKYIFSLSKVLFGQLILLFYFYVQYTITLIPEYGAGRSVLTQKLPTGYAPHLSLSKTVFDNQNDDAV